MRLLFAGVSWRPYFLLIALIPLFGGCLKQSEAVDAAFGTSDGTGTRTGTGEIGNSAVSFTPETYDFGNVASGSTSTTTITLTNDTTSTLYISNYVLSSSQITISNSSCPSGASPFASQSSCTVELTYAPVESSVLGATLNVKYDVSTSGSGEFSSYLGLSATGVGSITFDGIESIDNIAYTSMRLNWTANADATSFIIYNTTSGSMVYQGTIINTGGSIDSSTITGLTPSSSYSWRVRAIDAFGSQDSNTADESAVTSANTAPALSAIADIVTYEFTTITAVDAADSSSGSDVDANGDAITYTCYYDNSDNDSVANTNLCTSLSNYGGGNPSFNTSTGVLSGWVPLTADVGSDFEFKITGSDVYGGSSSVYFSTNVQPYPNIDPVVAAIADQVTAFNTTVSVSVDASDGDEALDCTTYLSISSSNTTLIGNSNVAWSGTEGACVGSFTPNPHKEGTATITVTVTDDDGATDSTSFDLTVRPHDFGNLELWLRADAGVTKDGSNNVTQWADQSNGNHNATAASGKEPLYVASGLNSNPTLRGNGTSTLMTVSGLGTGWATTSGTIYIAYTINNDTDYGVFLWGTSSGYMRYSGNGDGYYGAMRTTRLGNEPVKQIV